MVDLWKTDYRYQAPIYLAPIYLAPIFLAHFKSIIIKLTITCLVVSFLSACSEQKPHTAVQLNFKSPEQVSAVLEHLVSDSSGYNVSGNTLLASPEAENLQAVLAIIKQIDKPPQSYLLKLSKKNVKNYSTNPNNKNILLTEGLKSTTRINNTIVDILIIRAAENSSLMEVTSYKEVAEKKPFESTIITRVLEQKHNWIINHNQHNDLANDIFKNGFVLQIK
jgi:hypothetical protein